MSTAQTVKDKTVQPNRCLSFLKQAAVLVLALAALAGIFIAGTMYSELAQSVSSEAVYEATPERVNPALEGKLVKMRITELVAEGGPLIDELFGLHKENAITLHRFYQPHCNGRVQVSYRELHGIRESRIFAPRVKAGAYTIHARESFWDDLGGVYLNADELILPNEWEDHVIGLIQHNITLRTDDTSNMAGPQAVFVYSWIPSPWRGVRHVVGRQHGHELNLTGQGCGLIRGEEAYLQMSRIRPLPLKPWEYCLHLLVLLGVISLCLLPAMLSLQKRGWLRALYSATLLAMLLSTLLAAAWLLLPYAEHNQLTWTYTQGPCMIAFILLCFTCRKKS